MLGRSKDESVRLYDETGRYVGRVVVLGFNSHGEIKLGFDLDRRYAIQRSELPHHDDDNVTPATAAERT